MHGSTTNLSNMVKAPYNKLKEVRRHLTTPTPYPSGSLHGSESAIEESPSAKNVRPRTSGNTPMNLAPVDQTRHVASKRSFRISGHALTDDEGPHGREHAKVFVKGKLNFHRTRKHDEVDHPRQTASNRKREIEDLKSRLELENRFTEAQLGQQRQTLFAEEAAKKLAMYTAEEYTERSK